MFVKVPLIDIAMVTIVITNALLMFVPDKVNKAGRMAEQCGRKGAKQQVELREDEITMIINDHSDHCDEDYDVTVMIMIIEMIMIIVMFMIGTMMMVIRWS